MIIYFADRQLNILGQASTELPKGLTITGDTKTEEVETGVNIFECYIPFKNNTRLDAESWAEVGNYLLRSHNGENEFYTIIEAEVDTKNQEIYIYAEDAGMDLLNEVFGEFAADKAYSIDYYINKFAGDSGFKIGINEASGLTRKLSWEGEATAADRIASTATQFDGCEISYTFDIDGLMITNKYINIFKQRGKDTGEQLRLNKEIDSIITTKSIANLATALQCEGGVPDDAEIPITLKGYKYDDGDFYVDGIIVKSRKALERWRRFLWKNADTQQEGGHIVKQYSYDTTSQATLCAHAITELKKIRDMEVNYEIKINELPDNVRIGDRVNIIDDTGELYLSSRILKLQTSIADQKITATLGEYLLKTSGISEKVAELAAQFAKSTLSVKRAQQIANNAKEIAEEAKTQAETAATEAENANTVADEAKAAADIATESANNAQAEAQAATAAANKVEESVTSLEKTVADAQAAADKAQSAADTASAKAEEAKTAAANAQKKAEEAETAAGNAQTEAESAVAKANAAVNTADTAKATAEAASNTAQAAKLDAEQAEADIASLGERLTTVSQTMEADYARKTDLTEATAELQTQITQNAAEISSTASKVQEIDETANNAAELATNAQNAANLAQQQANSATADAEAAQTKADEAKSAAEAAQAEADTAKAAAATAQGVADKAEADLETAKADLATVSSRVDATEEEITAAQAAVETAQAAADKAKADAAAATTKAENAQTVANTAVDNANKAQTAADDAASKAEIAQQTANEAKGNAEAAQARANEAAQIAEEAQNIANTAKTNADTAQAKANEAAANAATAQAAADDAEAKAQQAAADLATAQQNLADVTSRVDATEEEVAAAQAAVETAQAAAETAKANAATAQSTADTAKANAATAQAAADNAKTAADNAQTAADEAKTAADKAQADVNALEKRVTTAETSITQNSEKIELRATKTEVTQAIKDIEIGGRNLATGTTNDWIDITVTAWSGQLWHTVSGIAGFTHYFSDYGISIGDYITFAVDINAINKRLAIRVDCHNEDSTSNKTNYGNYIEAGKTGRSFVTIQATESNPYFYVYIGSDGTVSENTTEQYKCIKVEKGNKATDWTLAPEDVSEEIGAVGATADDANERITIAESIIQQLADNISMLVTDGNGASLMTQTADGGWTFSTGNIQDTVNDTSASLDELTNQVGGIDAAIDILNATVSELGALSEYVKIGKYTYTDETGTEQIEPSIDLGESDTGFKLKITNTRIVFTDGANTLVSIDSKNKALSTQKIETEELQVGGWIWKTRNNGKNFGLVWKGATE